MNVHSQRKWLPAAIACVLLAGIFAPLTILGQSPSQQHSQLSALVNAAESSRSYAASTVNYAAANGLAVNAAQAQLSQGDSLLATAQADLQSGTNLDAGIQAVQAAISAYAGAAASAGIALTNAGLATWVDYYAALSAVAEVNATVDVVAAVEAQACASATTSGSQAFAQACAQVNAQVVSARADLSQAASLLVQTSGHAAASADISQALSLVAQARADVESTQSLLLTMAAYTYSQRGQAYVSAVVEPIYANANATIKAEQSLVAELNSYQTAWNSYAQAQTSAASSASSAASALATAIAQVNTSALTTSVSGAQSTETQLSTDLQGLLLLSQISSLPTVVADINTAITACSAYNTALTSVNNWAGSFSQAQISNYGAYLGTWNGDSTSAQTAGGNYLTSYQQVASDLSSNPVLQALPQVQAVLALPVSQTEGAANTSIQQATSAMGTVQTDITSLSAAISTGETAIPVNSTLLAAASGFSTAGGTYLNATVKAALGQVSTSASSTAQSAGSFVTAAQALLQTSIGSFSTAAASLSTSGTALGTQTTAATGATATAVTYVRSDSGVRASEAAAGHAELNQAMQLFASQDVAAGVAAMAQASLNFQAAAGVTA